MYKPPRFVYALHSPTISALKFGMTCNDVRTRIYHHRSYHQIHLDLLVVVEPNGRSGAYWMEASIHESLRGRSIRIRGDHKTKEWYPDSDECALRVLAYLKQEARRLQAERTAPIL